MGRISIGKALFMGAAAGAGLLLRSEYEKNHFAVEELAIASSKLKKEHTLVFITDLHDKEFGPGNGELLDAIRKVKPDAVLIGGDMMVSKGEGSLSVTLSLLEGLVSIAPVYYALGNHETRLHLEQEKYGNKYRQLLEEAGKCGVTMLINQNVALDNDLAAAGLRLPPVFYKKLLREKPEKMPPQYISHYLGKAEKEPFQILLIHSPLYFKECRDWGADLTLSGHFHGGTIRIPGLGGVMTPQYQFFLPWCAGSFQEEGKWMAVGRGLGTHSINIRLNNKPQLLVLRLSPSGCAE